MFLSPVVIAIFAIVYSIVYSIGAAAVGVLSGWLTALSMRIGKPKIRKDAFLGVLGFWAGFIGILAMPWHENTITERLHGGGMVSTTTNTYQHPLRVALLIAVILPFIYEFYRSRRSRKRALS